ncbi:MAG: uracil phosphoribosyltransferase [Corallococcus sp.]|nr:uracil phosphoribosyltransferase [Corallococcus sp.]MCM1359499.1 uracil phosphoribosyltransferase [Corallococcus sp.]MCM1394689.1 uracil phosphoribosyltransferase [Corallococcus sp.]
MKNVNVISHPLISHKVALLRNKDTDTKQFRELIEEISVLLTYEAFKDIPTVEVNVDTPLEHTTQQMIAENTVAIIPILRAGLGMVNGVHTLFPAAKVGHIGMYRDEETCTPKEYYCKLPKDIQNKTCLLLDPMLATGGSTIAAVDMLKRCGAKNIKCMHIIAAPKGVEALHKAHPDVQIYCATMDRELNENNYILPGLGDAGDRLFGTK